MKRILLTTLAIITLVIVRVDYSMAQKETRDVDNFTKISFGISGNLYLKQGNNQSLVLEGKDLDEIETSVSGGRLKIKRKGNNWGWNNSRIDVYITVRDLEGINLSGSGKVIGKSKFEVEDLDISVSGSGRLDMDVYAENIDSGISGSGNITLAGVSENHQVSISGSGRMSAEDMEVERYKIRISGSGSCRINVSKEIDANVSGSGSISYHGNPDKVYHHASGSGKIRKI